MDEIYVYIIVIFFGGFPLWFLIFSLIYDYIHTIIHKRKELKRHKEDYIKLLDAVEQYKERNKPVPEWLISAFKEEALFEYRRIHGKCANNYVRCDVCRHKDCPNSAEQQNYYKELLTLGTPA